MDLCVLSLHLLTACFVITAVTRSSAYPTCSNSRFAPCTCQRSETTQHIQSNDGKEVEIQYTEYTCNNLQNAKRATEQRNTSGLQCKQLFSQKTIYRSTKGESIKAEITYNTGCELRCIKMDCERKSRKVVRTHESSERNIGHICKSSISFIDARISFCKLVVRFLK